MREALRKETAQTRKEYEAAQMIVAQQVARLQAFASGAEVGFAGVSHTLSELGQWQAIPSSCQTLEHNAVANALCEIASDRPSLEVQERLWHERHFGQKAARKNKRLRGLQESPCHRAGTCLCNRTEGGVRLRNMCCTGLSVLKCLLGKPVRRTVLDGQEVLLLVRQPVSGTASSSLCVQLFHISLLYLRPWRPTFVALQPATPTEERKLLHLLCEHEQEGYPDEGNRDSVLLASYCGDSGAGPTVQTWQEVMSSLNAEARYVAATLALSFRGSPFVGSAGQVAVLLPNELHTAAFWDGTSYVQREPNKKRKRPTKVSDASDTDSGRTTQDGDAAEARSESEDSDKEEVAEDMPNTLLSLWDEVAAELPEYDPVAKTAVEAEDAVSTSSSSSSSSSSTSSSGEQTKKDRKKGRAEVPRTRTSDHTDQFGPHHLTKRFINGEHTGFHLTCGHPKHEKCTKELSASVAGNLQKCRVILKTWALMGESLPDRVAHMNPTLTKTLLDNMSCGFVLSEAELDQMVSTGTADVAPAPFPTISKPVVTESSASLLGTRHKQVPDAVHKQMIKMAIAGAIPVSTLAMRSRNTHSPGTRYVVPERWQDAL
eukprot:1388568-Amphidinium_carterae.1